MSAYELEPREGGVPPESWRGNPGTVPLDVEPEEEAGEAPAGSAVPAVQRPHSGARRPLRASPWAAAGCPLQGAYSGEVAPTTKRPTLAGRPLVGYEIDVFNEIREYAGERRSHCGSRSA